MLMRKLGNTGIEVGAVGLGCMGMSWAYQESCRDDDRSVEVIRAALDAGVTFLDTADIYGDGHNERLVGRAVGGRRSDAVIATKLGLVVDDLVTKAMHRDGSPAHVAAAVDASLRRLDTDVIDLYYLHRIDPAVPLADTWGAMAGLVRAGKVRHLGLSEVTVAEAAEAHRIHPVSAVQSELSLWTRDAFGDTGGGAVLPGDAVVGGRSSGNIVQWCADNGAAFVPFAPLGRGFLSGTVHSPNFEDSDFRASLPRFQRDALAANLRIVDVIRSVADRLGTTPAQVAIAWVLAQGEHVVPIPGTKNPRYLRENVAAADLVLSADDLAELAAVPAPTGSRY
ncbi:MAG: aldo/keto reductase [Dactylosporangium sp.]|nr:aldo/keto reductase [Dactylosporangium sp.]